MGGLCLFNLFSAFVDGVCWSEVVWVHSDKQGGMVKVRNRALRRMCCAMHEMRDRRA